MSSFALPIDLSSSSALIVPKACEHGDEKVSFSAENPLGVS